MASDSAALPLYWQDDRMIVEAMINGKGPFRLLLNTGVGATFVTPQVAEQFPDHLFACDASIRSADAQTYETTQALRIDDLKVGEVRLSGLDAIVFDLKQFTRSAEESLDGVIGYRAFDGVLLVLDYPAQRVLVRKGRLRKSDDPNQFASASVTAPVVPLRINGRPYPCIVDSGSVNAIYLVRADLDALPVDEDSVVFIALMAAGSEEAKWAEGRRLTIDAMLGAHVIKEPFVIADPQVGRLGVELLRFFRITLDCRNNFVRFDRESADPITAERPGGVKVLLPRGHDTDAMPPVVDSPAP